MIVCFIILDCSVLWNSWVSQILKTVSPVNLYKFKNCNLHIHRVFLRITVLIILPNVFIASWLLCKNVFVIFHCKNNNISYKCKSTDVSLINFILIWNLFWIWRYSNLVMVWRLLKWTKKLFWTIFVFTKYNYFTFKPQNRKKSKQWLVL